MPIHFLQNAERTFFDADPFRGALPGLFEKLDKALYVDFIAKLDKPCPMTRADYPDFPREAETNPDVLDAILWNSPQRIRQHCFRALLGMTFCHASNSLVNVMGQLTSLDHEKIAWREGVEDIIELRQKVKASSKVLEGCQSLCRLTPEDIEQSLSGIEPQFWSSEPAVFRSERPAIAYFQNRLASWGSAFKN